MVIREPGPSAQAGIFLAFGPKTGTQSTIAELSSLIVNISMSGRTGVSHVPYQASWVGRGGRAQGLVGDCGGVESGLDGSRQITHDPPRGPW